MAFMKCSDYPNSVVRYIVRQPGKVVFQLLALLPLLSLPYRALGQKKVLANACAMCLADAESVDPLLHNL